MAKLSLIVVVLFALCFSCKTDTNKHNESDLLQEMAWFGSSENFLEDEKYQSKFYEKYQAFLDAGEIENAKLLLYYHGTTLSNNYYYDSTFIAWTKDFIEQYPEVTLDTTYVLLLHYIADLNICDMRVKEAIPWSEKALELATKITIDDDNLSQIKYSLAYAYSVTNQSKLAIEQYLELIEIAERTNNFFHIGHIHNGIAMIYVRLRIQREAKLNFLKAIENFKKSRKLEMYFIAQYEYVLNDFMLTKDTLKTLEYIDPVLIEFEQWKESTDRALCYINGLQYLKSFLNQDYDAALKYNNLSMEYMKNTEANLYVFKLREAQVYFEKHGKFEDTQSIIDFITQLIEDEDYDTPAGLYHQLYISELKNNNITKALEYRNKEIELLGMVQQQNVDGQIFELEINYETEKKESQLAQQQEVILKNNLIIALLMVSLALLITGFLIYIQIKKRKLTQIEIERQEQFTSQLMENTEEERSRIANELHDSVNHELLTIKNNLIQGNVIKASDIGKVIEEVRNISRNLHPTILEKLGLQASIEHLCDKLTESGLFTTCDIHYAYKLNKNKELQVYRIIQEALNNTLKHGKANAAKVILTSQDNFLHLEIKDNGSGFDVNQQLISPKSFGLQSIMQRTKAILAKINIDSTANGTVIIIKIPVL